jgi:hypothetical protein
VWAGKLMLLAASFGLQLSAAARNEHDVFNLGETTVCMQNAARVMRLSCCYGYRCAGLAAAAALVAFSLWRCLGCASSSEVERTCCFTPCQAAPSRLSVTVSFTL